MFNKTKRLTTDDLADMARKCRHEFEVTDVENVLKNDKDEKEEEDDDLLLLPKHPFRAIIVGRSGSGKTVLTLNLLFKWLKYDTIYIICSTVHLQKKYELFCDLAELFPSKFKMYENMNSFSLKQVAKTKKNLILLDDLQELDNKQLNRVNDLFVRGRHSNCSVIFLAQTFYRVPIRCRGSANLFIFFKVNSEKDKARIHRDVCGDLDKNQFLKLFNEATEECLGADPFSYFVVDTEEKNMSLRYRKNFKQLYMDNL